MLPLLSFPLFSDEADKIMRDFLKIQNSNLDRIKVDGKFVIYSATDTAGFGNRYFKRSSYT